MEDSEVDSKSLQKTRSSYSSHLSRKANEIKVALRISTTTVEDIDNLLMSFKEIFDKFADAHERYREQLDTDDDNDQAYFDSRMEQFDLVLEKIDDWKRNVLEPSTTTAKSSDGVSKEEFVLSMKMMTNTIAEGFSLPKVEFSTFDGDPTKFLNFMCEFESTVEQVTKDESKRLSLLLSHCKNDARDAIDCCQFVKDGLAKAKAILKERFGQPYIISSAYIKALTDGPILKIHQRDCLLKLASKMENCELLMLEIGHLSELNASYNLHKIVERLPHQFKTSWLEHVGMLRDRGIDIKFRHLTEFVSKKVKYMNDPLFGDILSNERQRFNTTDTKIQHTYPKKSTLCITQQNTSTHQNKGTKKCVNCQSNNHFVQDCTNFHDKNPSERFLVVRNSGICMNCFIPGHRAAMCRKGRMCQVSTCKCSSKKHHTLLHDMFDKPVKTDTVQQILYNENASTTNPSDSIIHEVSNSSHSGDVNVSSKADQLENARTSDSFFPIVMVKIIGPNGKQICTNALLDAAADINICSEDLITSLDLETEMETLTIAGVGRSDEYNAKRCSLQVCNIEDDTDIFTLNDVWSVQNFNIAKGHIPSKQDLHRWYHLRDIRYLGNPDCKIQLLIGACTPQVFVNSEYRVGKNDDPIASKGPLGWTILGPKTEKNKHVYVHLTQNCKRNLNDEICKLWDIDSLGMKYNDEVELSQNDKKMIKIMNDSVKVTADNHYELGLPWRNSLPTLPDNRHIAVTRLLALKRRFQRDKDFYMKYLNVVNSYLEKGYASKINLENVDNESPIWYLPHHGVDQPHKQNVRVVFDCSATCNGESINTNLLSGPDLTNNLVKVLLNFRLNSLAISGDIEAMFHQVYVSPKDTNSLRFLWWDGGDIETDIQEYKMNVHAFGLTSSPACANYALKKTADDNKELYPQEVIDSIKNNFYVDDFVKSVETVNEAKEMIQNVKSALHSRGFNLTKFFCNDLSVINNIPENDRHKGIADLDSKDTEFPILRILGVRWDPNHDAIVFEQDVKSKPITKRGLLSKLSSIYDPLGFLSPAILPAKLLFQKLCIENVGWDERLNHDDEQTFLNWISHISQIENVKVSRCYKPKWFGKVKYVELHTFSDASEYGYGCVSYIRQVNDNDAISCNIVFSKSKLCPPKRLSIPRLELQAALISARITKFLITQIDLKFDAVYLWTDSTSVLQFLRNDSRKFKPFVGNRISEILDHTTLQQWHFVSSTINPADTASRGSSINMLINSRWLYGPAFLWEDKNKWPKPIFFPAMTDDKEQKKGADIHINSRIAATESKKDSAPLNRFINHFSSWNKLLIATVWILKYKLFLLKSTTPSKEISIDDLRKAEAFLISYIQKTEFTEYEQLISKHFLSKSSRLRSLRPFVKNDIMHVGGRLSHVDWLDTWNKHPIILPKGHFANLLIRHCHSAYGHVGIEHVLALLREKYWIIQGKSSIKNIIRKCITCQRYNKSTSKQLMSDLPIDRVMPNLQAFTITGVDFFGPMYVKIGRARAKRYGCIFTCFNSRATHLELCNDLSAHSFLQAFRRFVNRRGTPEKIYSDNGTNFIASEKELNREIKNWNKKHVEDYMKLKKIEWHFNPPGASHMGGVWERIIREIKRILKKTILEQVLSEEDLRTLLTEIENILNSRPLTPVSSDISDCNPLTPAHALFLNPPIVLPPSLLSNEDYPHKRWKQIQYLSHVFWKKWIKQYLPLLQKRNKWLRKNPNFQVGDLVLITDENLSRGKWPLARVTKVNTGRDGLVRSAHLKSRRGLLVRPITKLIHLELS